MWVSGKPVTCGRPSCNSTQLTDGRETFDVQANVFVGQQTCQICGAVLLYTRRPVKGEGQWGLFGEGT